MDNRLEKRIAIVTGSSSGNGRAIALTLSAAGAVVVCADRTKKARQEGYEDNLEIDTDDLIRSQGGSVRFVQTDVSQAREVENLIARTVLEFGRLDLMINNAGINLGLHTIVQETEEQYELTMNVNAKGVWLGCKFALTQMLKQLPVGTGSRGKIVNVASVGGLVGIHAAASYCASKGAVISLTRQLAADFSPHRINVNAVCPGYIATAMSREGMESKDFHQFMQQLTPYPRLGTCQDVAESVLFLSTPASDWTSGSILTVDGALTAK